MYYLAGSPCLADLKASCYWKGVCLDPDRTAATRLVLVFPSSEDRGVSICVYTQTGIDDFDLHQSMRQPKNEEWGHLRFSKARVKGRVER